MTSAATDLALAVLLHLQRWPYDADHGQRLTLDLETLDHQTHLLLPKESRIDWRQLLPELIQQRLVEHQGAAFQLTNPGRTRGQAAHRNWMAQGFEDLIRRSVCPAYDAFCRAAMDIAVGQLSPLDRTQLALLLSCIQGGLTANGTGDNQTPPGRLLDLGCGTGGVTRWLTQHIDAIAYGVDVAVPSAENTARRYGGGTGLSDGPLQFHRADITALRLPKASFHVLTAIDVVSFLDEPARIIRDWLGLLVPGGRLVILGSEHPDATGPLRSESPLPNSPAGPRFLSEISPATASASCLNLSALERHIYRRQRQVLPALRERFQADGQAALYDLLWREAQRYGHWADTGQSRRWLTVLRPV